MDWSTKIGILLVPLVLIGAWFWYGREIPPEPVLFSTFVQEGNLIKDNPGFLPGIWYLSYERAGFPGTFVPLIFNHDSRCGIDGDFRVCNISFEQGERVRIEGVETDDAIVVHHLIYSRTP